MNINIIFKDGTSREFKHEGRAGGSYSKKVEYKGNFVVVTDEWFKTWAFPSDLILEVQTEETRW